MTGDAVDHTHSTIFHFTKEPRYFAAVDEVREGYSPNRPWGNRGDNHYDGYRGDGGFAKGKAFQEEQQNPLGKLPGSVWNLTWAQVVERIVKGWAPGGICVECGEGRRPVHDGSEKILHRPSGANRVGDSNWSADDDGVRRDRIGNVRTVHRITGYACACPEPTAPTRDPVILILEGR